MPSSTCRLVHRDLHYQLGGVGQGATARDMILDCVTYVRYSSSLPTTARSNIPLQPWPKHLILIQSALTISQTKCEAVA